MISYDFGRELEEILYAKGRLVRNQYRNNPRNILIIKQPAMMIKFYHAGCCYLCC